MNALKTNSSIFCESNSTGAQSIEHVSLVLNAHLILAAHLQTSGILLHYFCAPPFQPKLTIQGTWQVLALLFFPPNPNPN